MISHLTTYKKQLIVLEGADRSGKTTLAKYLKLHYDIPYHHTTIVDPVALQLYRRAMRTLAEAIKSRSLEPLLLKEWQAFREQYEQAPFMEAHTKELKKLFQDNDIVVADRAILTALIYDAPQLLLRLDRPAGIPDPRQVLSIIGKDFATLGQDLGANITLFVFSPPCLDPAAKKIPTLLRQKKEEDPWSPVARAVGTAYRDLVMTWCLCLGKGVLGSSFSLPQMYGIRGYARPHVGANFVLRRAAKHLVKSPPCSVEKVLNWIKSGFKEKIVIQTH